MVKIYLEKNAMSMCHKDILKTLRKFNYKCIVESILNIGRVNKFTFEELLST